MGCRSCQTASSSLSDIDCAVGERPCLTAEDDHAFEIYEADVVDWSRCPDCRRSAEAAS